MPHLRRNVGIAVIVVTALLSSSPQAEIALALQQPDLVEPLFFPLQPQPLPAMPGAYVFDGAAPSGSSCPTNVDMPKWMNMP